MAKGKYHEWLTEDGLLKVQGWARDGLINEQIAKNMGISKKTLYEWCNRFSDLSNALKKSKEIVDREVENALLKRALGYRYEEKTQEIDEKGRKKLKVVQKEVLPDVTAQIYWLNNRKPADWRNKRKEEVAEEIEYLDDIEGEIYGD